MKELLAIPAGDLLSSGLFFLDGTAAPLWVNGENLLFQDGGVGSSAGLENVAAIAARPTGLVPAYAAERRLYFGAGANGYMYRTSDGVTNISPQSAAGGIWDIVPYGNSALFTNGSDPLEYWPNSGSSAPITAPFNRADTICKFGAAYVLAASTNLNSDTVYNCDFDDPSDWTVGTAGYLQIRDLDSPIKQLLPLQNIIGVYTQNRLVQFAYTGTGSQFAYDPLVKGIGATGPHSTIETPVGHFGFDGKQIFATTGTDFARLDEPAVRKHILDNYDSSQAGKVFGWLDGNIARWWLPTAASRIGLGFDIVRKTWTKFNDETSVAAEAGVWAQPYFANSTHLQVRSGTAASFAQTKPLDCGNRQLAKTFQMVELDLVWSGTVTVQLGWSDSPFGTITWDTAQAADYNIYPTDGNRDAVFISVKIAGTGPWHLNRLSIHGEPTGSRR